MTITSTGVRSRGSAPLPGAWHVDGESSHARFVARTLGGAVKVRGSFGSLSGRLVVGDEGASGVLAIDPASVDTRNGLRDKHLRGHGFLEVADHPEVRYDLRSLTHSGDDLVRLEGDLLVAGTRTALELGATLRTREDGCAELACLTRVDRVALGVSGRRGLIPRAVDLDVNVVLRPAG
jgi:polyisoprenoid-binding protein YceI